MAVISGSFEVSLAPQALSAPAADSGLSRMSLDKQFHGALEARSKGEMLALMDRAIGSGGYVAMEKVEGTLDGLRGSFLLQHSSTMVRGVPGQSITVVPDSGRHQLTGLSGSMQIRIEGGQHFYDFDYRIEPLA